MIIPDLADPAIDLRRAGQIDLGEQHPRLDVRLVHHGQVALQPPQVEVGVARLDEEGDIDVGRHELIVDPLAGRLPLQQRLAGEEGVDDGQAASIVQLDGRPVTEAGEVQTCLDGEAEGPRQLRRDLALGIADQVTLPVNGCDAGGRAARLARLRLPVAEPCVET